MNELTPEDGCLWRSKQKKRDGRDDGDDECKSGVWSQKRPSRPSPPSQTLKLLTFGLSKRKSVTMNVRVGSGHKKIVTTVTIVTDGGVNMNLFKIVKNNVDIKKVSEYYGVHTNRQGMTICPFHDDHNPSLKLNESYYYCFGCGATGDVIDFVARLFMISPYEAAKKIASDFRIDPDQFSSAATVADDRRPAMRTFRENENHCQQVLCEYLRFLRTWKREYAPVSMEDPIDERFVEACQMFETIEFLADFLLVGNLEERVATVNALMKDGMMTGLEERVKRAQDEELKSTDFCMLQRNDETNTDPVTEEKKAG